MMLFLAILVLLAGLTWGVITVLANLSSETGETVSSPWPVLFVLSAALFVAHHYLKGHALSW